MTEAHRAFVNETWREAFVVDLTAVLPIPPKAATLEAPKTVEVLVLFLDSVKHWLLVESEAVTPTVSFLATEGASRLLVTRGTIALLQNFTSGFEKDI